MRSVAYAVMLGLALPLVWFSFEWLRHFWFAWLITDQTYPVFFRLLYGATLIDWGFYFALFFAAGAAIAVLVQSPKPLFWAFGFGLAYSLMRAAVGHIWVPPFAEIFVEVWRWGLYLVPPAGATLGAFSALHLAHRSVAVGT